MNSSSREKIHRVNLTAPINNLTSLVVTKPPSNDYDAVNKKYVDSMFSIGDLKYSIRTSDFEYWLICDGRDLNREIYDELFAIIGTTFGSSSPTTFKLPNCKGKVLGTIGDDEGITEKEIGDVVGSETVTLEHDHLPEFNLSGTSGSSGVHDHGGLVGSNGAHIHTASTGNSGNHVHGHNAPGGAGQLGLAVSDGTNTENDVDSSPNELNVWTNPRALVIDPAGDHTHSVTIDSNGAHQHSISNSTSHTHSMSLNYTSENNPVNVLQPTIFIGNVFIHCGINYLD